MCDTDIGQLTVVFTLLQYQLFRQNINIAISDCYIDCCCICYTHINLTVFVDPGVPAVGQYVHGDLCPPPGR